MSRDPEQTFTKNSVEGTPMFNAKAEAYDKNRGPAVVSAARIHRPDGPPDPGTVDPPAQQQVLDGHTRSGGRGPR